MLIRQTLSKIHKTSWLMIIALLVAGCAADQPLTSNSNASTSIPTSPPSTPLPAPANVTDEQAVLVDLYRRVNPAVVNITGYGQQGREVIKQSQGSGFVYDQAGHIVTNDHVIRNAEQVEIAFASGSMYTAEIIGQDPHSDLAVLKVAHLPADVEPLPLGDMNQLAVGQTIVAIGNPFGLEGTLTRGIISALGRTIPALTSFSIPHAIQTDAAINPGNSGGPLLDLQGHVIGVNAQQVATAQQVGPDSQSSGNSGLNFAIPVDIIRRVVPKLINDGQYRWAWLGAGGDSVTPTLVEAMTLPVESGAYIAHVTPDGPADRAGLRGVSHIALVNDRSIEVGGDVVTAINGEPEPGQEVTLTIIREGRTQEVIVQLGTRPVTFERR
jgi:2-alkenal reductase